MLGVNILNRLPLHFQKYSFPKYDAYLIRILDSDIQKQMCYYKVTKLVTINGFKVDPTKSSRPSRPSLSTPLHPLQSHVLERLAVLLLWSLTLLLVHLTFTSAVHLEKDSCFLVPEVPSRDLQSRSHLAAPAARSSQCFYGVSTLCCNSW